MLSLADRLATILTLLLQTYPDTHIALHHRNPYQLLVATILSAQCTDERVNRVTPDFFARYPDPARLAGAKIRDIESLIRSTGFFRNKAKHLLGMAVTLQQHFSGRVPNTMQELITLPGVARKTANVVLGSAFGKAEGVVVDTHVARVTQRLGLTREKQPVKIERDLMRLLPPGEWIAFPIRIIFHGRQVCSARKPACGVCPLNRVCPEPCKNDLR